MAQVLAQRLIQCAIKLIVKTNHRNSSLDCFGEIRYNKALILGCYTRGSLSFENSKLTPSAEKYDASVCGRLTEILKDSGPMPSLGMVKILYKLDEEFSSVALVGLGDPCLGYNDVEIREDRKEAIRIGVGTACRLLQEVRVNKVHVESMGHAESAAEGAYLSTWAYQEFRAKKNRIHIPLIELYDSCDYPGWELGIHKANAQNLARQFSDTPANHMTPKKFAQKALDVLVKSGVNVDVKVQGWAETQKMGAYLAVAKGSCAQPIFLEVSFYGANYDERPIVLVGSGITFDSGGLCLCSPEDMKYMRGDMTGAAVVIAVIRAVADLRLPLNIRGLIPLCENMPGCNAYKPGDIVTAMNGKRIKIQKTCCEGRLVLADALTYSQNFWPRFLIDIGTLTKAAQKTMARSATLVFTNSDPLYSQIETAGSHTGDRVWRMPLWNHFSRQIRRTDSADIQHVGEACGADACRAAAFLREFVPCGEWMHLDNYGVMWSDGREYAYLRKGLSGRPTRTLLEMITSLTCTQCPDKPAPGPKPPPSP